MWVPALLSALFVGLHDWWTCNPDYKIAKNLISKKLSVNKQKVEFIKGERVGRWHLLVNGIVNLLIWLVCAIPFALIGRPEMAYRGAVPLSKIWNDKQEKDKKYK